MPIPGGTLALPRMPTCHAVVEDIEKVDALVLGQPTSVMIGLSLCTVTIIQIASEVVESSSFEELPLRVSSFCLIRAY